MSIDWKTIRTNSQKRKKKNQEIKQLEKSHYAVIPNNCCGTQGSSGLGTSKTIVVDDKYSLDIWVIHQNWKPRTSKRVRSQMTRRHGVMLPNSETFMYFQNSSSWMIFRHGWCFQICDYILDTSKIVVLHLRVASMFGYFKLLANCHQRYRLGTKLMIHDSTGSKIYICKPRSTWRNFLMCLEGKLHSWISSCIKGCILSLLIPSRREIMLTSNLPFPKVNTSSKIQRWRYQWRLILSHTCWILKRSRKPTQEKRIKGWGLSNKLFLSFF